MNYHWIFEISIHWHDVSGIIAFNKNYIMNDDSRGYTKFFFVISKSYLVTIKVFYMLNMYFEQETGMASLKPRGRICLDTLIYSICDERSIIHSVSITFSQSVYPKS